MEVLLNELSLSGQFKDENEFFDSFDTILQTIKLIELLKFSLLKEYSLFQSKITRSLEFTDFLRLRSDRARKIKRFLAKLSQNPPYWNETQKHSTNDKYFYKGRNISNTSLAESCERDRVLLSFENIDFKDMDIVIEKNSTSINLYNIINRDKFLEYLLSNSKIEPLRYCQLKFKDSNLDFSKLEIRYGFDSLDNQEQIDTFMLAFNDFSRMSWEDIIKSDGLEYKQYSKPKKQGWFLKGKGLYSDIDIYKFRVTQKYRCFGYREKDEFFVLRFETDHKQSDNG